MNSADSFPYYFDKINRPVLHQKENKDFDNKRTFTIRLFILPAQ